MAKRKLPTETGSAWKEGDISESGAHSPKENTTHKELHQAILTEENREIACLQFYEGMKHRFSRDKDVPRFSRIGKIL